MSETSCTIERDLSALKEMGVLRREGNDNDGMWVRGSIFMKNVNFDAAEMKFRRVKFLYKTGDWG